MKWLKNLGLGGKNAAYPKGQIGAMGEDAVAKYIQKQGLRILERNWRHGRLELDIIAEDGDILVFIEVKTRQMCGKTSPVEGITAHKRASFLRAVKSWLSLHDAWNRPCRFDVAGVLYDAQDQTSLQVEYYDNAFDFSTDKTLGGGNSSWQPW